MMRLQEKMSWNYVRNNVTDKETKYAIGTYSALHNKNLQQ